MVRTHIGVGISGIGPAKIRAMVEYVSDALSQTEIDLRSYIKEQPGFKEVSERMQEWAKGRQISLQAGS